MPLLASLAFFFLACTSMPGTSMVTILCCNHGNHVPLTGTVLQWVATGHLLCHWWLRAVQVCLWYIVQPQLTASNPLPTQAFDTKCRSATNHTPTTVTLNALRHTQHILCPVQYKHLHGINAHTFQTYSRCPLPNRLLV